MVEPVDAEQYSDHGDDGLCGALHCLHRFLMRWLACLKQSGTESIRPFTDGVPITVIALRPNTGHDADSKFQPVTKRRNFADLKRAAK
jgi:hypothetical protein